MSANDQRKKHQSRSKQLRQDIISYKEAKKQLINGNWHLAKTILNDLYNSYPGNDDIARDLAVVLANQDLLDEAITVLEQVPNFHPLNFKELLPLYIRQKNYDKAHSTYISLTLEEISQIKMAGINDFYRLVTIYLHRYYPDIPLPLYISSYLEEAFSDYNVERAIHYTKLRHLPNKVVETQKQGTLFTSEEEIDILFQQMKPHLDELPLESTLHYFTDSYICPYKTSKFNHIRILTVPNTDQILTLYPISYTPNLAQRIKLKEKKF